MATLVCTEGAGGLSSWNPVCVKGLIIQAVQHSGVDGRVGLSLHSVGTMAVCSHRTSHCYSVM